MIQADGLVARFRPSLLVALSLSLALHAGLLAPWTAKTPPTTAQDLRVSFVQGLVQESRPALQAAPDRSEHPAAGPVEPAVKTRATAALPTPPVEANKETAPRAEAGPLPPASERKPASLPAPPAPSAEEWQRASTYMLKNSKRYRHNWGQQVRSMMGTAVEGPDQGLVRLRIEIAPDGKVTQVEELWSTSARASKLAMQAIRSLPPLPPTPTGKPLVFEQTISFLPYETGWPPSYKLDCLPDMEAFNNPFAWDGSPGSAQVAARSHRPPPPAECVTDSTADSIEEEEKELKRQMDQWRWGR